MKVLIPVDGSENALRAVRHIVDHRSQFCEPIEVHLLNVQPPIASGSVKMFISQQQLKEALEHSAKFFRPYEAGKSPAELVNDKVPSYNFDLAEGVEYDIDVRRPIGDRIQNLRFQGKPLTPTQKLRLATNNYRVNGGGGYVMYKNAPVVYRSSEEIREMIIDWVESHKTIPTQPTNNWKLLP